MGLKANEVTAVMLARILSTVRMKIAHATCTELVVENQPFDATVNKVGLALTAPCSPVLLERAGSDVPRVETIMHI